MNEKQTTRPRNATHSHTTPEPDPDLMRVDETAAFLGVSRETVYRLARRGDLPGAHRIGKALVISRRALQRELHGE